MASGASPLSPDILDFLRMYVDTSFSLQFGRMKISLDDPVLEFVSFYSCFGGFVTEGYGMTETACVISGCDEGDRTSGHVGSPNPACGEFHLRFIAL